MTREERYGAFTLEQRLRYEAYLAAEQDELAPWRTWPNNNYYDYIEAYANALVDACKAAGVTKENK